MNRILIYDQVSKMFVFAEVLPLWARLYTQRLNFRIYGGYRFPEGTVFPTFTASQLVDALMWASQHGERITGPLEPT